MSRFTPNGWGLFSVDHCGRPSSFISVKGLILEENDWEDHSGIVADVLEGPSWASNPEPPTKPGLYVMEVEAFLNDDSNDEFVEMRVLRVWTATRTDLRFFGMVGSPFILKAQAPLDHANSRDNPLEYEWHEDIDDTSSLYQNYLPDP